jgi:hypothetical protein
VREEGLDGRDRSGFVVHGVLGQRDPPVGRQRREEVWPWGPWLCGAAPRLAIPRQRPLRRLWRCGQTPDDTGGLGAHVGLALLPVHVPQERVERRGPGGAMGEAEGLGDPCAIMASPCGNGTRARRATPQRPTRQRD